MTSSRHVRVEMARRFAIGVCRLIFSAIALTIPEPKPTRTELSEFCQKD